MALDAGLPFGTLAGRVLWSPLQIPGVRLTAPPLPTRFHIGPRGTGYPSGVGARVHAVHFSHTPPFVLKVLFACVGADRWRRGPYADPRSPWHNVFFGAYEARVDAETWGRPFAFPSATSDALADGEEVLRLGKADWNDLSNGLYGVPRHAAAPHDALGAARWQAMPADAPWQAIHFSDITAVSAHLNPQDGGRYEDVDPAVGILWRQVFGRPTAGVPLDRPSFAPVTLAGRFWLRWLADRSRTTGRPCFRTFVAGAIHRQDHPDTEASQAVLDAQIRALQPFLQYAGRRSHGTLAETGRRRDGSGAG